MGVLSLWLPRSCSRLRIFICYAREDRDLAVDIAHALTNDGHDVFIDANSLTVATDFNEEIRRAIGRADRFVFLASRHSLASDAYPQTELGFAQKRWPAPKGVIWPILVDSGIDPAELPPYLRAVQVHVPKGNIVADLAAAIEASRKAQTSCLAAVAAALLLTCGLGYLIAHNGLGTASASLVKPQQIVLMPSLRPDKTEEWKSSPLALTVIPVSYTNDGSREVRIGGETVSLAVGNRTVRLARFNKVNIQRKCSPEWLCTVGSIGPETVKPRDTLPARETMFLPVPGEAFGWKEFVAHACESKPETMEIELNGQTESSGLLAPTSKTLTATCRMDLKGLRGWLLQEKYCDAVYDRLPLRLNSDCLE